MHFDQRTQRALRDVGGLSTDQQQHVSAAIVEATRNEADRLEAFFDGLDTVYSDMEQAHTTTEHPEHHVKYLDLYTHANEIRGYLRFDTWGVYVDGGRVLEEDLVELTLGPTVYDRVRFTTNKDRF